MNNDLISREALKQALSEPLYRSTIKDFGEVIEYTHIMNTIDNAPTVEVIPTELHEKIMDMTTGELLECQSHLRPQGEWIVEKDVYCRCPFCNFKDVKYSNYCPDCGADMRPKPNQLRDCENCVHHSDNGCEVWECKFKRRSS